MKRSSLKRKTPLRARGKKARAKASRTEKRESADPGPRFYVDALPVALNLADFRIYAPRPDPKPLPVRRKCEHCIHDAHTGMCTGRNGGTGYPCPCIHSSGGLS